MTHLEGKWGKCSIKTELKMGCNIIVAFAPIWILISESIEIIKVIGNSIHSSTLKPKLMEWSEKIDLMETSLDRLIFPAPLLYLMLKVSILICSAFVSIIIFISGWKSSRTYGLIWNLLQQRMT